ncbi:hepatitis A virus cellular receptor 1 homolog isoform X2 [Meriones unguiculatus]|uniref:hepatitis A virus cellular receptor 1 homolog isoform X2 n=1 Tax=Meriones unguiculatus TaxID=10047 RepID=UPI00293F623A|nr:hepatitis A virus cellular receptor 1 homolog isoform X2 [Meriones unguiculatus]
MIQAQVFILGLMLLLPGAVDSYRVVRGLVGHPVTLACTQVAPDGVKTTCWGRGECPLSQCANTLIWANRNRVTYQRSHRYQLKGYISKGNVSLTIEDAVQSDSGLYCCRMQLPGWLSDLKLTFSLEVKPETTTFSPHQTRAEVTETQFYIPTDWNNTVTSSDDSWNNYTGEIPAQKLQRNRTKGFSVGISIVALVLMMILSTMAITTESTGRAEQFRSGE